MFAIPTASIASVALVLEPTATTIAGHLNSRERTSTTDICEPKRWTPRILLVRLNANLQAATDYPNSRARNGRILDIDLATATRGVTALCGEFAVWHGAQVKHVIVLPTAAACA